MDFISTTSLATTLGIPANELFAKLKSLGWIDRQNDKWVLTDSGKEKGGQVRNSPKFGDFIVWPENISLDKSVPKDSAKLLNATAIGKNFSISSQRLNLIISELGWIEKNVSGWTLTNLGKNVGGKQFEHDTSGGSYVLWPEGILNNKSLLAVFNAAVGERDTSKPQVAVTSNHPATNNSHTDNFREKFEAKHRTKDGHYVRSRAEVIIDDTLYDYGLVHAYEKKVPIEEELYTDFYLPNGKVYIEFWGLENDPKYLERKKKKLELYQKYELKLIELNDSDILNLDDYLPKKLLKFGIKVY